MHPHGKEKWDLVEDRSENNTPLEGEKRRLLQVSDSKVKSHGAQPRRRLLPLAREEGKKERSLPSVHIPGERKRKIGLVILNRILIKRGQAREGSRREAKAQIPAASKCSADFPQKNCRS